MEIIAVESSFREQIIKQTGFRTSAKRRWILVSWIRFFSFAMAVACMYGYYLQRNPLYLFLAFALCLVFILLVKISVELKDHISEYDKIIWINQNELNLLEQKPSLFNDGASYKSGAGYLDDLDIFGPSSLFHLLNRTASMPGEQALAARLMSPFLDKERIEQQQAAIKTWSPQLENRQQINAIALKLKRAAIDVQDIQQWMNEPLLFRERSWLKFLSWILPAFNILAILYFIETNNKYPAILGISLAWGVVTYYGKYIRRQQDKIEDKHPVFRQFSAMLKEFTSVDTGSSVVLKSMVTKSRSGFHAIGRLSRICDFFEQRSNKMVNIIMGSLFVYDVHIILALENWKHAYRENFSEWIHTVAEIETLGSFSAFAFSHPNFSYPELLEGRPVLEAGNMKHPLIPGNQAVANDLSLGKNNRLLLITGSNMSGKTTYLRTIGVNLILAECGAPVNAAHFRFTPLQILSSIRVSDSLQEHTSFFMAELKRLKVIVEKLEWETPSLVLTDEIMRGTNSVDKTYGSAQFIRKLITKNCLTLFATHDLSLGSLETEFKGIVSNYCFESTIDASGLHFDYTLRAGVASNKNASYLMEMMGIIDATNTDGSLSL